MTLMLLIYEDIHVTLVATLMQAARSAYSGRWLQDWRQRRDVHFSSL
jgi:hypothetical protein